MTAGLFRSTPARAPATLLQDILRQGYWQPLGAALLAAAGYYAGAKLGLALTFSPHPISVLWPPNSILLAALLLAPVRWWWIIVLTVFPVHLLAELQGGVPLAMVLCWFVSNVTEALIGAVGLRVLLKRPPSFESLDNVGGFILCAVLLAPFLSSFLDAGFVRMIGWGEADYWQLWRTRFFSNILTTLTIVPVIVTWATGGIASVSKAVPGRLWEGALLVSCLLAVGVFVFDAHPEGGKTLPTLLYLPLPLLLWAALRFGPGGSSTAFMIVALVVTWGASHGRGPFATDAPVENAASVQTFLTFVGAMLLVLAAVVRERTNSERKLRSSEERFATAFRASPDAMAISRKSDGHLIEVNERWLELFNHRREEVIGRTVRELGLFADRNDLGKLVTIAGEQADAREVEVSLRTGTGEIIDGLVTTKAAEMEGEHRLVTIIRDNTERRRVETALRESEARFRSMADTAPVMIWMSDTETHCTFFNKGWLDFTGRRLEQELRDGWADGIHRDDLEHCVVIYSSAFEARRRFEMEFRLRRHDGKYRWVVSVGVPRVGADGTFLGYIGSCMDITDRKEAEETNQRLGHVSRLAVIGELTASIAHEINQPLGAILSNADAAEILLNSKVVPLGELRQIIDDIRKDDLRAGEVIRHIRDLLRRGELAMQPFDLNRTVADVIKLMSGELGRQGIVVHTEFAFLPIIDGDQVHLQQVVVNLILNAAEAMAEVQASRRRLDIRTARSDDGSVEVTVADSGPGIAAEAAECLFDSFFTTKSTGMGLGLSIARSIVEAHGGTIRAETRPQGGACFRIVLPARSVASEEAPPASVRETAS